MEKQTIQKKVGVSTQCAIGMAILFQTYTAYAGGDIIGGGGDIVHCLKNGQISHYLLDVYEAKNSRRSVDLGLPSLSVRAKLKIALDRLAVLDPVRAKNYQKDALELLEGIEAVLNNPNAIDTLVRNSETEIKDLDDADEEFQFLKTDQAPTELMCSKSQLIKQDFSGKSETPYLISILHYLELDTNNRVAMILHEVIYKEFRQKGAVKSVDARRFNDKIITNTLPANDRDYKSYIQQTGLAYWYKNGESADRGYANYDSSGQMIQFIPNQTLALGSPIYDASQNVVKIATHSPESLLPQVFKSVKFKRQDWNQHTSIDLGVTFYTNSDGILSEGSSEIADRTIQPYLWMTEPVQFTIDSPDFAGMSFAGGVYTVKDGIHSIIKTNLIKKGTTETYNFYYNAATQVLTYEKPNPVSENCLVYIDPDTIIGFAGKLGRETGGVHCPGCKNIINSISDIPAVTRLFAEILNKKGYTLTENRSVKEGFTLELGGGGPVRGSSVPHRRTSVNMINNYTNASTYSEQSQHRLSSWRGSPKFTFKSWKKLLKELPHCPY